MWRWLMMVMIALMALGVTLVPQPAAAQQGVSWYGEYFPNSFLFAPTAFTRTDGAIAFNWGQTSPGSGMPTDGFSVRWGADPYFQAGTYRFWALADDAIRINVGYAFQPQINTIDSNDPLRAGKLVSADITLTEGVHHIQVDYQEFSGDAYAYVTWANLATNPSGPNFPNLGQQQVITGVNNGTWTAQYYSNVTLSGSPTLIQSEAIPTRNWGSGSPVASIPADNWSARWTSVQMVDAGQYRLSVRADDGVRVYVDGVLKINEWHGATGQTYTSDFTLTAGQHNIMVEYYEAAGDAFLDYSLSRVTATSPTPIPAQPGQGGGVNTGVSAAVTAARLNFRNAPNPNATILLKLNQNEVYPVTGKTADSSWVQITVNGVSGWVYTRFVTLTGNFNSVPVVTGNAQATAQPVDTGYIVTALDNVNVRSAPSRSGAILARMQRTETARVVGRTGNNRWWQVNYNGTIGWVSSTFAQIQPNAELGRIPVTG